MRNKILAVAFGLSAVGWAVADQPLTLPPPNQTLQEPRKLRTELEALVKDRESTLNDLAPSNDSLVERVKLRTQLLELVKRLGEKKTAPMPAVVPPPKLMPPAGTTHAEHPPEPAKLKPLPTPPGDKSAGEDAQLLDPMRRAMNLYKAGDIDAALRTFRLLEPSSLPKEDRAFVQYMAACCLRRLGKSSEAAVIYRELADAKDDEFIADSAIWQLTTLKSAQELQSQLEQLSARRKSR